MKKSLIEKKLKQMPFDCHTVEATKAKTVCQLPSEHLLEFCRMFERTTEGFGFLTFFKTAKFQVILYTTIAYFIFVITTSVCLLVTLLIPITVFQMTVT